MLDGEVIVSNDDSYTISMGMFCVMHRNCVIRPPKINHLMRKDSREKAALHTPLLMGSFILIKEGAHISSCKLGRRIIIGENAKLLPRCTLEDSIIIDDGVTVPENIHIPSYTRVRQHPQWSKSISLEPLSASIRTLIESWCKQEYLGININISDELP